MSCRRNVLNTSFKIPVFVDEIWAAGVDLKERIRPIRAEMAQAEGLGQSATGHIRSHSFGRSKFENVSWSPHQSKPV